MQPREGLWHGLKRPFRYPGRCPGLGLGCAVGAGKPDGSKVEASKGRPKVGGGKSDTGAGFLGRPFRAWGFGGVGYPGRCPGLKLGCAFGAGKPDGSKVEASKGRPKVGGGKSDTGAEFLGRPFRAWVFWGVGYPGRCPGLKLGCAFGAEELRYPRHKPSRDVGGGGTRRPEHKPRRADDAGAPKGASQAQPGATPRERDAEGRGALKGRPKVDVEESSPTTPQPAAFSAGSMCSALVSASFMGKF